MLFTNNKKTELNKTQNFVLGVARFCAQMSIKKNIWFSQVKITEKRKKENEEETKTFSIQILFLTLSDEEHYDLERSGCKNHPKIYGEIVLKKGKENFSLEKVDIATTVSLKDKTISSFFFSSDPKLTELTRYPLWMSEKQKDEFAEFAYYFSKFA